MSYTFEELISVILLFFKLGIRKHCFWRFTQCAILKTPIKCWFPVYSNVYTVLQEKKPSMIADQEEVSEIYRNCCQFLIKWIVNNICQSYQQWQIVDLTITCNGFREQELQDSSTPITEVGRFRLWTVFKLLLDCIWMHVYLFMHITVE